MFRFAQVVLCVSITVLCLAGCQVPTVNWKFISYVDSSSALATQQTSDGGYMLAGYKGDANMYLVKLDAEGSKAWEKTYTDWDTAAQGAQQTDDGGYVMVGTASNDEGTLDMILLVKTDASGDIDWFNRYAAEDPTNAGVLIISDGYAVQQTSDGGYMLAGEAYYNGQTDACIVKTGAAGEKEFAKVAGDSTKDEHIYAARQTEDGGYILAGAYDPEDFASWVTLIKLNSSGEQEWQKLYQYNADDESRDYAYAVIQTSDHGYAVAGHTHGFSYQSSWILKVSAAGIVQWSKSYDPDVIQEVRAIKETPQGDLLVAGSSHTERTALVKTASDGDFLWSLFYQRADGGGDDAAYALGLTDDGGCIMAGYGSSADGPLQMEAVKVLNVFAVD
jgi:hypothetical protein